MAERSRRFKALCDAKSLLLQAEATVARMSGPAPDVEGDGPAAQALARAKGRGKGKRKGKVTAGLSFLHQALDDAVSSRVEAAAAQSAPARPFPTRAPCAL